MIEEEEKYDDFLESLKEEYSVQNESQDSFGKGILKANEEHKKTEQLINQRVFLQRMKKNVIKLLKK